MELEVADSNDSTLHVLEVNTEAVTVDGSPCATPAGIPGTDSFTYAATDGDLLSNPATVTIDVQAVSPPSLSIADASASVYDGSISFNVTLSEASTNLVKIDYVQAA